MKFPSEKGTPFSQGCRTEPSVLEDTKFIRRWTMHDRETPEEVSDKIELVFVELRNTEHADVHGLRGQWTTFLTVDTEEPLKDLCTSNVMFGEGGEYLGICQ